MKGYTAKVGLRKPTRSSSAQGIINLSQNLGMALTEWQKRVISHIYVDDAQAMMARQIDETLFYGRNR